MIQLKGFLDQFDVFLKQNNYLLVSAWAEGKVTRFNMVNTQESDKHLSILQCR